MTARIHPGMPPHEEEEEEEEGGVASLVMRDKEAGNIRLNAMVETKLGIAGRF